MPTWNAQRWESIARQVADAGDVGVCGRALEDLAKVLIPDLADMPLRVFFTSSLDHDLQAVGFGFCGWVSPILCDRLRLPQRGPVVVLADDCRNDHLRHRLASCRRHYRVAIAADAVVDVLATFVHEAAHCIEHLLEGRYSEEATATIQTLGIDVDAAFAIAAEKPRTLPPPDHHQHAIGFTRYGLHLLHRCQQTGADIRIDDLHIAGPRYLMSSAAIYANTLGNEPVALEGSTFAAISKQPMPHRFAWRYELDKHARGGT